MLRAWQCADTVRTATSPRAWLLAVARRIAVDRWRSRQARPPETPDTPLQFIGLPDHADATVAAILVREAVADLSPKYRAAITEVFLHDRTTQDTASHLGIPVGTVKSRLHAAMRTLRATLNEPAA
jgi:RNA polymerase sigma-70 factor (ECF subfamily)